MAWPSVQVAEMADRIEVPPEAGAGAEAGPGAGAEVGAAADAGRRVDT